MKNRTYHQRGKLVHGYKVRKHPLYITWADMKSRCSDKNTVEWMNYGGRGITYDSSWEHFENFANDMWPKPEDSEIDRIDVNGNYCKENCRWVTKIQNAQNKRTYKTNKFNADGVKLESNNRYSCRVMRNNIRYHLGRFATVNEASDFRIEFLKALDSDIEKANDMLTRRARYDSSIGIKGISRHSDGGYIVRKTVNNKRVYLGYTKDIQSAMRLLQNE